MSNEKKFDVLVVGAGPAGLMAATWMARTGIKTLVVEKKSQRTQAGHADGLESRTLEILDSFGIGKDIWAEANRNLEVCLWNGSKKGIWRESFYLNHSPGLSRYQEATLGQGRIEEHLLGFVQKHPTVEIEWDTVPYYLDIANEDPSAQDPYPIQVQLVSAKGGSPKDPGGTPPHAGTLVRAKYVIGCDGAHSWTRKALGLTMEGAGTNMSWGVLDCVPITRFPDVRKRCIIKSDVGNLMIIPREGQLVRFYVQLDSEVAARFKQDSNASTLVTIIQAILQPFDFLASKIEWSTIYTVGQRLCKTLAVKDRVFLAGDAIHIHSPKAGQGMNVSMQDTYNLGWKLALVIKGMAHPRILPSYQAERLPIGQRLLAFDRKMCQGVCSAASEQGALRTALAEENSSASGLCVVYDASLLVTPDQKHPTKCREDTDRKATRSKSYLASNITVGGRLASQKVLRQSDSLPLHLQELWASTGQWYLVIFAGDITDEIQTARVQMLADSLSSNGSFFQRLKKAAGKSRVGSISPYLIHCAPRHQVELLNLPEIFRPFDPVNGMDYGRVFADNEFYHEGRGKAFQTYGVGAQGCLVLLRPDQHVAFIGDLEDTEALERFFDGLKIE